MAEIQYKPIESNEEAVELLQYAVRFFTMPEFKEVRNHPATPHHLNLINHVQRYLCPDLDPNDVDKRIQEPPFPAPSETAED